MRYPRNLLQLVLAGFLITLASCRMAGGPVGLVEAFPNLSFVKPVFLTHPGDGSNRLFVVQQNGLIMVFNNHPATAFASVFLDVSTKISSSNGEEGLLGLAFHPEFASNGIFFIDYTAPNPLRTVVARYHVSASDPSLADTAGEVVFEVNQPYSNHNGGMLAFGPDGYLYVALGDGGSAGDPQNNAQSLTTLLGKILRIDVNGQSQNRKYAVPSDNPFVGNLNGYREEIWAYGLRNPWRFSFDSETGELWAGDVGQGSREEVDIIGKGKNYGWRIMEGFDCYSPSSGCDQTGLTLPLIDYPHSEGISITGGYVYRGSRCPDLVGSYLYGDYGSRRIWRLQTEAGRVTSDSLLFLAPALISSFGEDKSGELYVVTYSSSASTRIYTFDQSPATGVERTEVHPRGFELDQNFPNPFNPTTRISYSVGVVGGQWSVAAEVRLAVYDLLGREVAVLVDEQKQPGEYNATWDARGMAGGFYVYRLAAGRYVASRPMLFLK